MFDRTLLVISLQYKAENIPGSVTREYDIMISLLASNGSWHDVFLYFRNFSTGYQVVKGLPQNTYSVKSIRLLAGLEQAKLFKFDNASFVMDEKSCVILPLKFTLSINDALKKGDKYPFLELKELSAEEKVALQEDLRAKYPDFKEWKTK